MPGLTAAVAATRHWSTVFLADTEFHPLPCTLALCTACTDQQLSALPHSPGSTYIVICAQIRDTKLLHKSLKSLGYLLVNIANSSVSNIARHLDNAISSTNHLE